MTLRQHILDIIGQEHAHLRGKALLERYYFDGYNNGYESGKSFKDNFYYGFNKKAITKLVHYDVALKLGVIDPKRNDVAPEQTPTFESQLSSLLKDYIADLVYDEVAEQMNKG